MQTQVFLSLDHSDADFVAAVHSRLPIGMAIFYEKSFQNFEDMLAAMDRTTGRAQIFAFFVNKNTTQSKAVQFEMSESRRAMVFKNNIKIAVFPTDNEVSFRDLPIWMQDRWVPKAGYNANDVARYITSMLLDSEVERGGIKVAGRGKLVDQLDAISAEFLQRNRKNPNAYILAGLSGIGRRTFATYYARNSMDALPNLNFGPLLILPDHAELEDVYRAIRQEVKADRSDVIAQDVVAFRSLADDGRFSEIGNLLNHFVELGQAVRIVSTSGFFEDDGTPKVWALPFFHSIPESCVVFIVSNRQFDPSFIDTTGNAVQVRVEELSDRDIRSLMVRTADRLQVKDFQISDELVSAIGGHPDVANAAVSVARQRGVDTLNRDPVYLYNIQQMILGDLVLPDNLNDESKVVLDALAWVPELGSDILFEIFKRETGQGDVEFVACCQALVDGCVIVPRGFSYQISSSVRHLYRRWNVTTSERLDEISFVLRDKWEEAERRGQFREDLFEAFVFMYALTGTDLPDELKRLLSPGTLASVVRETYARGKSQDDKMALERVIKWGAVADKMDMSDSTREEILGTVARAYIRARKPVEAQKVIDNMREKGFVSIDFLQGHLGVYPLDIRSGLA